MRTALAVASAGCLLILGASNARAQSFDCTKARTRVEHMICSESGLSRLDEQLAALFRTAVAGPDGALIRRQQMEWYRQRERCEDDACVENAFHSRIAELSGPAPTPSAALPAGNPMKMVKDFTVQGEDLSICGDGVAGDEIVAMLLSMGARSARIITWVPLPCSDEGFCDMTNKPSPPTNVALHGWHRACIITLDIVGGGGYVGPMALEVKGHETRYITPLTD